MNRVIHINFDWTSDALCGRSVDYDTAWLSKVKDFLESYPKTRWCKTCKMFYNANQSNPKLKLK